MMQAQLSVRTEEERRHKDRKERRNQEGPVKVIDNQPPYYKKKQSAHSDRGVHGHHCLLKHGENGNTSKTRGIQLFILLYSINYQWSKNANLICTVGTFLMRRWCIKGYGLAGNRRGKCKLWKWQVYMCVILAFSTCTIFTHKPHRHANTRKGKEVNIGGCQPCERHYCYKKTAPTSSSTRKWISYSLDT